MVTDRRTLERAWTGRVERPPPEGPVLTRTTTQLLDSLRDTANAELWRVFDGRYRPVLVAFGLRRGLDHDEAHEAAQATLAQFAADYAAGRYDRSRGRLRSWIIGIAQNRIADLHRSRARRGPVRGESALVDLAGPDSADRDWENALRATILERALAILRQTSRFDERTIRAFELAAVRQVPAEAVASECGMSVDEVYVAKNRVIRRLREIVAQVTREFDD